MSIPRDNYVGEPLYPDPWTTNKPREGLRDIDEARIVSLAPDVCLTPVGSSVVPIPYPVVDFCGHDKNYTPSVRFTRKKAMVMRSCTTHVHGDKPGIRKGRKSGTVESICEPIGHADQVRAEGSHVIRHLDRFYMNNKNTEGEAIFVRSTQTYAPPKDDDPVPGSLRWQNGSDEGRVMSDASPEPLIMGAQYAQLNTATVPQSGGVSRRGTYGRPTSTVDPRLLRALRFWSSARGAAEVINMVQQIAEDRAVQASGSTLGLNLRDPTDVLVARAHAWSRHHLDASPFYWDFPNSQVGREAATKAITSVEAAAPGTLGEALQGNQAQLDKLRTAIRNAVNAATAAASVRVSGQPCAREALGVQGSRFRGGAHFATALPLHDKLDSHHTPADSGSYLPTWAGPAIQMLPEDHRATLSYGRKVTSPYISTQARLINSGQFMKAISMDIIDIKRIAVQRGDPTRYDAAIAQMMLYAECLKREGIIK